LSASFSELVVWQKAIQPCVVIYRFTSNFPADERFGLTNQLRRASVSISSNIAEGYGRSTKGEYKVFLGHARGSVYEVQTQLRIAAELGFGSNEKREEATQLSNEVGKMLVAMIKNLPVR
jgi:four helix bundle protein